MREARVAFHDGYIAAKAAHSLGEFQADVTAANNQEMPWNTVQFEGFDVR